MRGDCGDGRRGLRRAVPHRRLRSRRRRNLDGSPPRDDRDTAAARPEPCGMRHLYRSPAQRLLGPVRDRQRRPPRRDELSRRARRHLRLRRRDELLRADLSARNRRLRFLRDRDALAERAAVSGERPHPHGRGTRRGTRGTARPRPHRLAGHPPRPRARAEARRTADDGEPRARRTTAATWATRAAPTCSTS